MFRRVALAVALVLGSALLAIGDPPAKAVDVCAGNGRMRTAAPLFLPVIGPPTSGGFVVDLTGGLCGGGPPLHMDGWYQGDCLTLQMSGTTALGQDFNASGVGGFMVLTGEVMGVAQIIPDAAFGDSCVSGANDFIVNLLTVMPNGPGPTIPNIGPLPTVPTIPPLPTVPTTPTIPPPPPLPGGPAGPSADCAGAIPVRTTVQGQDVKVVVDQAASTVTVCVRIGGATGFGGKLVILTPSGSLLPGVGTPRTDDQIEACADEPGNRITGPHPLVEGSGPVSHLVDAYVGDAGVFACISLHGTDLRVVVPMASAPTPGGADADWYADPGTPPNN